MAKTINFESNLCVSRPIDVHFSSRTVRFLCGRRFVARNKLCVPKSVLFCPHSRSPAVDAKRLNDRETHCPKHIYRQSREVLWSSSNLEQCFVHVVSVLEIAFAVVVVGSVFVRAAIKTIINISLLRMQAQNKGRVFYDDRKDRSMSIIVCRWWVIMRCCVGYVHQDVSMMDATLVKHT